MPSMNCSKPAMKTGLLKPSSVAPKMEVIGPERLFRLYRIISSALPVASSSCGFRVPSWPRKSNVARRVGMASPRKPGPFMASRSRRIPAAKSERLGPPASFTISPKVANIEPVL